MLIALVAMFASAETYSYLKFTKTDNSTVAYSVEGLKVTYDARSPTTPAMSISPMPRARQPSPWHRSRTCTSATRAELLPR